MPIALWKKILRDNFTSLKSLSAFLELDEKKQVEFKRNASFPLLLPKRLAEKIKKNTLDDPILRQFIPTHFEDEHLPCFVKDPVGDSPSALTSKYLQKYQGRVLLVLTGACAMHCRYCFRQNYAYAAHQTGFQKEIECIRNDGTLKEIILSGGDPLSLNNTHLKELLDQLSSIPHLQRIRFHTRFPIGIPERIDEEFLRILELSQKQIWFVIHSNHPDELDSDVLQALKKIQKLGIPLLNQSVLLKGVNDSIEVLQALCEKLVDHGIIPYYLHQLDRVEGAAHFEVDQAKGLYLIDELNKCLAGYGVPKYVQEIPSAPYKVPL